MDPALSPLPRPPEGVRYALTVPQSVLFADLSLHGNRADTFERTLGISYEPLFIGIDNGAMSWRCDRDEAFEQALGVPESPQYAIERFTDLMERTTRRLELVSIELSQASSRGGRREHLISDLETYWGAYTDLTSSLFTFWNVEAFLMKALIAELRAANRDEEIANGLLRFLTPMELNYYQRERRALRLIAERFDLNGDAPPSDEAMAALERHAALYGFLMAPFNLGSQPTGSEILGQIRELFVSGGSTSGARGPHDTLSDLPSSIQLLGLHCRKMAFWKTHRIDILTLADTRFRPVYEEVADALRLTLPQLFSMTHKEILQSLVEDTLIVPVRELEQRRRGFCLALVAGTIGFYTAENRDEGPDLIHPLTTGSVLHGLGASAGTVSGTVRIVSTAEESEHVTSGEILVARMTRPEMGRALDRAAAFVTEEGGLLCHAAIISREMGKPCVIGVAGLTKRLANGMAVKVDGSTGTIEAL